MNFTGTVIEKTQMGISPDKKNVGENLNRITVVISSIMDNRLRLIPVTFYGKIADIADDRVKTGDRLSVKIVFNSWSYNGRWHTSVIGKRFEVVSSDDSAGTENNKKTANRKAHEEKIVKIEKEIFDNE